MCCLFGFVDYGDSLTIAQKNRLIRILATECEARGTDATGIAYNSGGKLNIFKKPLAAHRMKFHIPADAQVVMGHTRFTTQGSEKKNHNNHPFLGELGRDQFALAHNGVLHNDFSLRRTQKLPHTKIETDSYIAVQLIEQQKSLNLQSLREMAELVEGSFVFTTLEENDTLSFIRGDNPLCLYHYPMLGLYLYASTQTILDKAIAKMCFIRQTAVKVEVDNGDILQIDRHGELAMGEFDCPMPYQMCYYSPYSRFYLSQENDDAAYIKELKSVATAFGYTPEDVDVLIHEGISPEEIEDYFYSYCGER